MTVNHLAFAGLLALSWLLGFIMGVRCKWASGE